MCFMSVFLQSAAFAHIEGLITEMLLSINLIPGEVDSVRQAFSNVCFSDMSISKLVHFPIISLTL